MLSRRGILAGVGATISTAAFAGGPEMVAQLFLAGAAGSPENMTLGHLVLAAGGGAVRYRLAFHQDDLPRAHWRTLTEPVAIIPWMFPGHQSAYQLPVCAEVEYSTGPNEIVSALEHSPRPGGMKNVPARLPMPAGRLLYADCLQEPIWPLHHYADSTPYPSYENSFVPLLYHSDGYGWVTDKVWGIDIGETPDDIIVARFTAHDLGLPSDFIDLSGSGVVISAHVGAVDLDLKGGYCCFGVVSKFNDGKRGRYHLRRPFAFGAAGVITENAWGLPSGSNPDWVCSWGADGVGIPNMPTGPSLAQISEVDIIFRDWASVPSGECRIQKVEVYGA